MEIIDGLRLVIDEYRPNYRYVSINFDDDGYHYWLKTQNK